MCVFCSLFRVNKHAKDTKYIYNKKVGIIKLENILSKHKKIFIKLTKFK